MGTRRQVNVGMGTTWVSALFIGLTIGVAGWVPMAGAFDIEGLPGSTWGQATYEGQGLTGPGAQGYLNQGIDWTRLPGGLVVNTFAEFRFRLREKNKTFYNAYGPAVGLELRRSPFKLGLDYYWERFPDVVEASDRSQGRIQYYLSWYYEWDLKR